MCILYTYLCRRFSHVNRSLHGGCSIFIKYHDVHAKPHKEALPLRYQATGITAPVMYVCMYNRCCSVLLLTAIEIATIKGGASGRQAARRCAQSFVGKPDD